MAYERRFWDLPIQGLRIRLAVGRWRCRNTDCEQSIFTERWPGVVAPRARQTRRAAGILRLGHGVGGRPGARLAARLGFVGNRTTILRHLIRQQLLPDQSAPRVVGLDEWAARKIARDRDGVYADASRQGAPQARQIADRFHLVQNLRDRIEQHLSGRRQRPVNPIEQGQDGQIGRTSAALTS